MSRFVGLAAIRVGTLLLASGTPLLRYRSVLGVPLLVGALLMAAFGVATRRRRLEEIGA